MLYGRKENNRVYLIWGIGRVAGLERESFIDRFWENHESCCRHRQVHSHSVLAENEVCVLDLLAWRVQGLGKTNCFIKVQWNQCSDHLQDFCSLRWYLVEGGPSVIHLSGSHLPFSSHVEHMTWNHSAVHFLLLAVCSFGLFIFPGKNIRCENYNSWGHNLMKLIIWFSANFVFPIVMCPHSSQGKMERESGG